MQTYLQYLLILGIGTVAGIFVLSIAAGYLWNSKRNGYRWKRIQQGHPTASLSNILNRTARFIFKEETGSVFEKANLEPDEENPTRKPGKPVPPALQKVTYKKLYLAYLLAAVILALIPSVAIFALIPLALLALTIYGRTAPVFKKRHIILMRMFEIAAAQLKYGRGSEQNPWGYINIQSWENLVVPADTVISIPTTYPTHQIMSRDAFEAQFSNTVTDKNSWDYEWKATKNQVIVHPVRHLTENAPYTGSEKYPWDVIPLGEGVAGPVCINLSKIPHVLVAGPTGSGKSVLQLGLLFHAIQHNDVWRFIGIDLKRVELSKYRKYKKTVKAIAVDLEAGVELTKQIKDTMMERYQIMEDAGVNHFLQLKDERGQHPKAIMFMVDEAYVFMSLEGGKTDEGKQRDQWHGEAVTMLGEIARLGRAAGIHLIIATQRPDAAVIPGELRSNLENRVAAGRLNTTSSSMILDSGAGTRLPAIKGRGIVSLAGETAQFQGYFSQPEWIDNWLETHKEHEPSLFGLPDEEDDVYAEAEDNIDFVPDEELEFVLDRAAQSRLESFPEPKVLTPAEVPAYLAQEHHDAYDMDPVTPPAGTTASKLTKRPIRPEPTPPPTASPVDEDDFGFDFGSGDGAASTPAANEPDDQPLVNPFARNPLSPVQAPGPRRVSTPVLRPETAQVPAKPAPVSARPRVSTPPTGRIPLPPKPPAFPGR